MLGSGPSITEFRLPGTDERVLVNRKPHGVVLLLDSRETFAFDGAGRILYGSREGFVFRRGLDNSMLRIGDTTSLLGAREAMPHYERAYSEVARVIEAAPPAARESLGAAARCGVGRLEEDARRFREIYGAVPILPPEQYGAIYLQAAIGCAYNRCSFCTFYRDRRFRVRTVPEFERHLREVVELLGPDVERRNSIFLGDSNALDVPTSELAVMMRLAGAALPGRQMHAFVDATVHRKKTRDELVELRGLGMRRLTIGVETANEELYRKLRKPASLEGTALTVQLVKSAGLEVGVAVMAGIGGRDYLERHSRDTLDFVLGLGLGPGDVVYVSPLRIDPASEYAQWAREGPGRVLGAESLDVQVRLFHRKAAAALEARGVKVVSYDVSRFVY